MYGPILRFVFVYVLTFVVAEESSNSPQSSGKTFDYDLIVIGGGSGGLAAAKAAKKVHNKRVLVVDYVSPSPQGTHWGEGGTCVNVGCIPKKLMHQAALIGEAVREANKYGWEINDPDKIKLNWAKMREAVQDHVKSVNWVLRTQLTHDDIKTVTDYINGLGEFVNANKIKVTLRDMKDRKSGKLSTETKLVTAENILIAVGGRPKIPDIEGAAKLAITSDDLFSLRNTPGKTLIVGAGYIALECAGFLRTMGMDVTVVVRSEVLKGFDREMVELVKADLQSRGIKFLDKTNIVSIVEKFRRTSIFMRMLLSCFRKEPEKQRYLHVKWKKKTESGKEEEGEEYFNTVIMATGRRPLTAELKVDNANIELSEKGYVKSKEGERTNIPNIFAVGDVLDGKLQFTPVAIQAGNLLMARLYTGSTEQMDYNNVPTTVFTPQKYDGKPQLTPVAIQAGKLLMARLYTGSTEQMDYNNVPTTVFTPQEYGFVGLTEEKAEEVYGKDNIEVYHQYFNPTEYAIPKKGAPRCFLKVICKIEGDQKVLGMHYFGPMAGEVIQGYAAALKAGLTFAQLRNTVGIHPTASEEFTRVSVTKRSGDKATPQSCCS